MDADQNKVCLHTCVRSSKALCNQSVPSFETDALLTMPQKKKGSISKLKNFQKPKSKERTQAQENQNQPAPYEEPEQQDQETQEEELNEDQDQIPVASTSASKRKLGHVLNEADIAYSPMKNLKDSSGYRFLQTSNFLDLVKVVHNKCRGNIEITELNEKRMGVDSVLTITCDGCDLEYVTQSSKQQVPGTWRPQDSVDINTRLVYALTEMGCSKKQMETFCSIMDIPVTSCARTMWEKRVRAIHGAHRRVTEKLFRENREELLQHYPPDADGKIYIPVTYDATWMTRGYNSTVGVGFVMSLDTGKPLDASVKVNYCQQCNFCSYKKHTRKYRQWLRLHKPNCKFDDINSKEMEAVIAEELWRRSQGFKIYYRFMVCDGDSSAWKRVRFIYGACKKCKNYYEKMSSDQQAEFDNSEGGPAFWANHRDNNQCLSVQKENCINHVKKGLGTALRNRRTESNLGKTAKNTKHRLTDFAIKKREDYFRNVLVKYKLGAKATAEQYTHAIKEARREILAGHFHSCVSESDIRHYYCRAEDGWCKKVMNEKFEEKPYYLEEKCRRILMKDYKRFTSDVILRRCLRAKTQNQQESINNMLWARIPKRKYHGRRRVETAVDSTILNWCLGSKAHRLVMDNLQLEVGKTTKKIGLAADKNRVKRSLDRPMKKKIRKIIEKNADYGAGEHT